MAETPAKKTAAPKKAETPTEYGSLAEALAAFQGDIPTVAKAQTATIPGKDGRGGYSYKYADLADVAAAAYPVLARYGLSFTTRPIHLDGVGFVLEGVLRHASGGEDRGVLPIQGRDAQAIGSSLTYHRRYLLGCMTGIVTDEDDDGSRAAAARTERPEADQRQGRQPAREDVVPVHVQMVYDIISSLNEEQKTSLASWWDQRVSMGQLPERANMAAVTPDQAALVEDAVVAMLESNSQDKWAQAGEKAEAAQGPQ